MKLKNLVLIIAVIAYTYLFYDQSAGINFLLFNVLIIVCLGIISPNLLVQRSWQVLSLGAIVSASLLVWHHSQLALFANIISIILLMGISYSPSTSLYISFFHGLASLSFPFFAKLIKNLIDVVNPQKQEAKSNFYLKSAMIYLVPVAVTFIFFVLYANASPVFADFFNFFQLNISVSKIIFGFVGWIWLTGFFEPTGSDKLTAWDAQKSNILTRIKAKVKQHIEILALKLEHKKGVVMLLMLNALLLCFNVIDLVFMFSKKGLPQDMTYSEYVHNGVNTLIFSILFAIVIILYYFRGNQNFYKNNRWLLGLAYVWIVQNGLLLLGIIYKNQLYIAEFGLTYKRIGVYVYLLMTSLGLITTFWKVKELKTAWFLLRTNTNLTYIILIISCFVNWDKLIAQNQANRQQKADVMYLIEIGDSVLPELQSLLNNPKVNLDLCANFGNYRYSDNPVSEREFIQDRIKIFKANYPRKDWQSWNYEEKRIFESLH